MNPNDTEDGGISVEQSELLLSSEEARKLNKFLEKNPDIAKKFYIKIERNLWKKVLHWKITAEKAQWALEVVKQLKNLFS